MINSFLIEETIAQERSQALGGGCGSPHDKGRGSQESCCSEIEETEVQNRP